MIETKTKILISGVIMTGILAVGQLGVLPAKAQETNSYPPIIRKLAEKFNLNVSDVEDVFEEVRAEKHAEMQTRWEEKLSRLVAEGKITDSQKALIMDKHEEMRARMDALKELGPEERKAEMDKIHEEMKTWAEVNGIEFPFMAFKMKLGHRAMHGGFIEAN